MFHGTNIRATGRSAAVALSRHIGILYVATVLDQPSGSYIPETESWTSRGTSPAVEAGDLPGANFRETPLSESEQSMARRKRR